MGRGYNMQFLLYPQPMMWWNSFLLFYMCHSMMGLTRCYKTAVFLHYIFAVFRSQSIAEVLPLPLEKTNDRHMEILHPVSMLNFLSSSPCNSARMKQFCLNWTITEKVMTLCRFFKVAAVPSQIFFCFLILWHLAFRKAKNYLRIKFRLDISIHGQDITTSCC